MYPRPLLQHVSTNQNIQPGQVCSKRHIADCVTYSQSHTIAQPLANPVDPVLTVFDHILAYYTVLASQLEAVSVWQNS